jgi:hypothetical protein
LAAHSKSLGVVRAELERYAQRGVFRSFSEKPGPKGSTEFRFNWLWNLPFCLQFDPARRAIVFRKLLPNVAAGSDLNAALKAFLEECASADRPEHRRIDPKRLAIEYSNRRGSVTLTFIVARGQYEYGVRRAINLVNELFVGFLNLRYPRYMVSSFDLPEE